MANLAGGVFATRDDYWTPINLLEPIVEERSSRRESDFPVYSPAAKRLRTGFECERCGQSFTEKRSLARHHRHVPNCNGGRQSLKPFACEHCSKSFTRDDVRQRHVKEKHLNIKRRPRGLGFFANLGPGSTNRSGPRTIGRAAVHVPPQSRGPTTGPPVSRSLETNDVRSPWRCDGYSDFGTSSPTSVYSFAESRIESNASPRNFSTAYRRRESSSSGSDMSTGSSLKFAATNTPLTTYSSEADQVSVLAETCDSGTQGSHDGDWSSPRRVSFDLSSRELIKGGASTRPASHRKARVCPLCSKSFGTTMKEVRAHFNRHSLTSEGQHKCDVCEVGFVHKADLDHHLSTAQRGSCGLLSHHTQDCSGHHPPSQGDLSMTDHERIRLEYCVQNWEQAQLRDFISVVQDVTNDILSKSMVDDSWSVDGAFQRSIQSLSIRFSGLDIRSTPEYMGQHVRTAMHRVRRLVGNRVPFGPDASFKISLAKKSAKDVRLARTLTLAAADGNIQEMNASILQGADIDGHYKFPEHEGSVHCTPLMAAVCSGNKSAVEFLLENEAAVDGSHDSLTIAPPLCLAAEGGDIELVKCLLLHNAKVNKEAKRDGGHAACFAARNGHTETLSLLMDYGVDVHRLAALDLATDELPDRFTPFRRGNVLAIATHHNHLNTVKMLLNRREIDFEYCDASAALVIAAYHGNLVIIELLLEKYPQLCTFFATWVAASQGYKILVDVLMNHQKQNKSQLLLQAPTILKRAIKRGQADLASLLLSPHSEELCDEYTYDCRSYEAKCARDLVAEVSSTPVDSFRFNVAMGLNCAIYYHDVDTARIFLEAGLNPNIRIYPSNVRYLATNLMLASRLGDADMVKLLLEYGADPAPEGHLCLDLLEAALESESVETLRAFFDTGRPFVPKIDEWSCSSLNAHIQMVVRTGATELLQTLIDGGLDVNQIHVEDGSMRKTTLLHLTATSGQDHVRYETMKLLAENGADTRTRVSS